MSAVIQPTGPKQDKRNRYFALLGYPVLTPKQAAEAQRLAGKILKADAEKAKADAKGQAKGETARILYEARLEKCEQARTYLETLQPVSAASVKAFDEAIVAAKALAQKGEHAKATEALDKVSATHAPDKGAKAWNEAATAAEKLAPRAFQALKKIDALLADPESRLDRATIAAARQDKFDQGRVLLAPKPAKAALDGATQALEVQLDTLRNRIDKAKADWNKTELLRAETSRKLNMIAPLTGDVLPLLTDREAAPMRLQLASAATSMNLCDFAGAQAVLAPLRDELDAIADRLGPQRDEWTGRAPRLRPLAEECKQLAAGAECPKVRQDAAALSAQLQQLLAEGPGKSRTLGEAIDLVDGASARMDTLRGQEQAFMVYQRKASGPLELGPDGKPVKPLETSKRDIERLFGEVNDALKKLHTAVSKATQGNHETVADAPFVQRRDAARDEWTKRAAQARDPQALDEAGMAAQLKALQRDILATQGAPAKLQVAIDDGRLGRRVQAYHEARAAAMAACDELLARDAMAGADARLAVERICEPIVGLADIGTTATMISAYDDAIASLKSKAKRIGAKTAVLQQDIKAKQDALVLKLEAMGKRVLEVKALADAAKNATKQAPLVALFETLQASLDGLRAMARLGQRDGLQRTDEEADEFAKEIDQSLAAAKGDSDDTMSFDKARKAIADLKEKLAEKKHRLYCVSTQDELSTKVKELEEQLGTMTMGELTRRIGELRGKVGDLKLKAGLAEKETEKFESDVVKPLLKRLDDKAFKDAPEYRASMKSQIEALVGEFRFEDGQDAVKKKATALGDKLTAVLQGGKDPRGMPLALAAEQAAAQKAANDKIVEQGKWDGEVIVLEKKLAALKPSNSREVEPLIDLLDSARTTAKKSGDYAAGRSQLASIRKRMSLLAANPHGLAISARNKLPQVNARVRRAIVAYQDALATIDKAVQALPLTDLDAAGKQAVTDQLDALRGLFNPGSFEDAVATLSAKGGSREQRSGEREKGLREVRRMQAYLNSDGRLRTLRDSPWNKAMPSVLSELMLALLDIENNMLVSI